MSRTTHITITGGEGQLASALSLYFPLADYPGKQELDITSPEACERYFSGRSVALIIHTAAEIAYNASPDLLQAVNVEGTRHVTAWAERLGARLVYLSTDYCYPGTTGHYAEDAPCAPVGAYAASKYAGEGVALGYANTLAIRTSFYSRLHWQAAALDAYTSRMPIADAAPLIAALSTSTATGIVNVGGPRRSFFEIAVEFNPRVQAISRRDVHLPYPLPADSSLDCSRMEALLGI